MRAAAVGSMLGKDRNENERELQLHSAGTVCLRAMKSTSPFISSWGTACRRAEEISSFTPRAALGHSLHPTE